MGSDIIVVILRRKKKLNLLSKSNQLPLNSY